MGDGRPPRRRARFFSVINHGKRSSRVDEGGERTRFEAEARCGCLRSLRNRPDESSHPTIGLEKTRITHAPLQSSDMLRFDLHCWSPLISIDLHLQRRIRYFLFNIMHSQQKNKGKETNKRLLVAQKRSLKTRKELFL